MHFRYKLGMSKTTVIETNCKHKRIS